MSKIKTGTNLSVRRRRELSAEAARARSGFINRNPRSGLGETYHKTQIAKKYLVKGRAQGRGKVIWDVYELDGFAEPKVVGADFAWQEEAIAFARDKSLGRISLGLAGLRGVFRAGRGGILSGDKTIELPGSTRVKVQQTTDGVVVG